MPDSRAAHLETLYEIGKTISSSLDLDEVLNLVMDKVIEVTRAQRGFLMLTDGRGQLDFRVARGLDRQQIDDPEGGVSQGVIETVARTGQPLVTSNAQEDARLAMRASVVMKGLRSVLCVPLAVKGDVIGVVYVDNPIRAALFDQATLDLLTAFAGQAAIAIDNARLYRAAVEKGRMERELTMARDIQRSLLPARAPTLPGWDIAADWRSAREVAGDFYDFVRLDDKRLGIIVADVSDKGAPAALFMAVARSLIRGNARAAASPADLLARANDLILEDSQSGMFVTAFYLTLTADSGAALGASAGHNPPLVYNAASGRAVALPPGGVALGWFPEVSFADQPLAMGTGDVIVLYTDGVTDAENEAQEAFGEARLTQALVEAAGGPAAEILRRLNEAVSGFMGGTPAFDDLTMIVVKRL